MKGAIYSEQGGEADKSDPLLDYAFQVLNEITCNPGHFNRLCDQLVSTLNSWPTLDDDGLGLLIDELVSQVKYVYLIDDSRNSFESTLLFIFPLIGDSRAKFSL